MELLTQKFHIVETHEEFKHKIYILDYKLCNKMNKLLNQYQDYKFQEGEEGIFYFTMDEYPLVKKILKIRN